MAKFSKRDYDFFARILKAEMPKEPEPETVEYMRGVAADMSDWFAEDNPRFDRHQFLVACGFYQPEE